jgi:hypothetical protein
MAKLHVYSQYQPHCPAFIVGDREGLITLRQALTDLLEKSESCLEIELYTHDGEGYPLGLVRLEDHDEESWENLYYPYSDTSISWTGGRLTPFNLMENLGLIIGRPK